MKNIPITMTGCTALYELYVITQMKRIRSRIDLSVWIFTQILGLMS